MKKILIIVSISLLLLGAFAFLLNFSDSYSNCKHVEVVDKGIAATCLTDGKTDGSHCSLCGKILIAQENIPAVRHVDAKWITYTVATDLQRGKEALDCPLCNALVKFREIPECAAQLSVNGVVYYYETFDEAWLAVNHVDNRSSDMILKLWDNCQTTNGKSGRGAQLDSFLHLTLDLNGYILSPSSDDCRVLYTQRNSVLTIIDSYPLAEHWYRIEDDGLYVLDDEGGDNGVNVLVCGGAITGGDGSYDSITSNYKTEGGGGAIFSLGGAVEVEGGNIIGNKGYYSGGIYLGQTDSFAPGIRISGGRIIGNISSFEDCDSISAIHINDNSITVWYDSLVNGGIFSDIPRCLVKLLSFNFNFIPNDNGFYEVKPMFLASSGNIE